MTTKKPRREGASQNVSSAELAKLHTLDDSDLAMVITLIQTHGWAIARRELARIPAGGYATRYYCGGRICGRCGLVTRDDDVGRALLNGNGDQQ